MLTARLLGVVFALFVATTGVCRSPGPRVAADRLPAEISDRVFQAMVADFSEPPGTFRSDNLVSNESTFQEVIPELARTTRPGGVYIGVGPEQNFTYIAALKPRVAFIVDIRRQNLLLHLLYKALVELSPDRVAFVSRLFSRPPPPGIDRGSSVQALFEAQAGATPSWDLYKRNLDDVVEHLTKRRSLRLSTTDVATIDAVYGAFWEDGPALSYSTRRWYGGYGGPDRRRFPAYVDLMTATDSTGTPRSYLSSEDAYGALRDLHLRNLVVPVVGDFAGNKALRSIGAWVRQHGAAVTAFYTSNVEQYLFRGGTWQTFLDNVATLPIDEDSLFVRAYFNYGFRYPPASPDRRSLVLLGSIADLLQAHRAGRVLTYGDVIDLSRPPAAAGR